MVPRIARAAAGAALVACACARPASPPASPPPPAKKPQARLVPEATAVPDLAPRTIDDAYRTYGTQRAALARRPPLPTLPVCKPDERRPLAFDHTPVYSEAVGKDAPFTARLLVGNASPCTRRVTIPLSFTPPKTTATRTIAFAANVPAGGAYVKLELLGDELSELDVNPGRYAITFAVVDEDGHLVGHALSGNPFRRGEDAVAIASPPDVPPRIERAEDLVIPIAVENRGDTPNRVTPLVVFTRPRDTKGLEHYGEPISAPPGVTRHRVRLTQDERLKLGVLPGPWLVTVTMFDAAGDRMNTYPGIPLTIGSIDVHMLRPDVPVKVPATEPIKVTFHFENKGDTADVVTAAVVFTKPGTPTGQELVFVREVPPGKSDLEAAITVGMRRERGIEKGVWLVTTVAFRSSGERIKSFTGHYLEIVE